MEANSRKMGIPNATKNITTGISAHDRAFTIKTAIKKNATKNF